MNYCDLLDEFLDGDLNAVHADEFRAHVTVCKSCQLDLEAHDDFLRLVGEAKQAFDDGWSASRDLKIRVVEEATSPVVSSHSEGLVTSSTTPEKAAWQRHNRRENGVHNAANSLAGELSLRVAPSRADLDHKSQWIGLVIAAAVVFMLVVSDLLPWQTRKESGSPRLAGNDSSAPILEEPNALERLEELQPPVVYSDGHLAERIPTSDPTITIYRLHPTIPPTDGGADSSRWNDQNHEFIARRI